MPAAHQIRLESHYTLFSAEHNVISLQYRISIGYVHIACLSIRIEWDINSIQFTYNYVRIMFTYIHFSFSMNSLH